MALGNEELLDRVPTTTSSPSTASRRSGPIFLSPPGMHGLEPPLLLIDTPTHPIPIHRCRSGCRRRTSAAERGQRQFTRMLKYLFEEVCEPHESKPWPGEALSSAPQLRRFGFPGTPTPTCSSIGTTSSASKRRFAPAVPPIVRTSHVKRIHHYKPPIEIEKLRCLHAHYAGAEGCPWHGGLQVDICQFVDRERRLRDFGSRR